MVVLSERRSQDFLEKEEFRVVERDFCFFGFQLRESMKKIGRPFVLRAAKKNSSKAQLFDNVEKDIKTYTQAREEFKNLKRLKKSRGVLVQRKVSGREFFVAVKKIPKKRIEISFGFFVENSGEKEMVLKIYSKEKKALREIPEEASKLSNVTKKERKTLKDFVSELVRFAKKKKEVKEVTIGSLVINAKKATIVGARVALI